MNLLHVRIAIRALLQRPGFALLAILTLAVGTGATTVIFTVISGVLLKPLVYQNPDTLLTLHGETEKYGTTGAFPIPIFWIASASAAHSMVLPHGLTAAEQSVLPDRQSMSMDGKFHPNCSLYCAFR